MGESYPREEAVAREWFLHPHEARPRAETFLHERKNWIAEVEQLRTYAQKVEAEAKALRDACTAAFNIIDGSPCPIDSPEEWRWQVRAQLIEALRK